MGCDIHAHAEHKIGGAWRHVAIAPPFDWRDYGVFGFLADVRNYSGVPPISAPRGFPDDASAETKADYECWGCDGHTPSWLSVTELLAFDYDAPMEDRRVARNGDGGCTCDPGTGEATTFRVFLGDGFVEEVKRLQSAGVERVVFWFDN